MWPNAPNTLTFQTSIFSSIVYGQRFFLSFHLISVEHIFPARIFHFNVTFQRALWQELMPIKTRGWARIVLAKINMTVSSLLFYKSRLHNPGPHRHGMKLTRSRYNGIRWLACSIWEWYDPSKSPERFPSQYMSYRKAAVLLVPREMTRRKELSIDMLSYRVIFNNNIIQLSGAFYMFKWHFGTPTEIKYANICFHRCVCKLRMTQI